MDARISRRGFVSAVTAASAQRVLGANDRVRLGVIGSGGRGRYLMERANSAGRIEWVALCDADDAQRNKAETVAGKKLDQFTDYRRV